MTFRRMRTGKQGEDLAAAHLAENAPGAHLALDQVILSGSVASRVTALRRLIDGLEPLVAR